MVIPNKAEGIDGIASISYDGFGFASNWPKRLGGSRAFIGFDELACLFTNSCATLFTLDIYGKLKPNKTEKQFVFIGRLRLLLSSFCRLT